jgi:hypothetical protein
MKRLRDVMDEVGREALWKWLTGNALEMAQGLVAAGWEEDERGRWSKGKRRHVSIFDAHEVARQQATCDNGNEGTR